MDIGQDVLIKGIELCHAGRKRHAGRLFVDLLRQEPTNEQAWWWLAACVETEAQKRDCLERLLSLNPNHHDARTALRELARPTGEAHPSTLEPPQVPAEGSTPPTPPADDRDASAPAARADLLEMAARLHTAPLRASRKWAGQFSELVEAAHAQESGEEFNEAYNTYSKVLEIDNFYPEGWLGKGFTAGMQSSASKNRVREFLACMQRGILALEPNGTPPAQAVARMDPAMRRAFLDRLLRLYDYIYLLAGRCAPDMANIYLVEMVELADWSYLFSQPLSLREGRLCTRADLISTAAGAYQRIALNVVNTTRGPRARRELLANFHTLLLNSLKLSSLKEDPELAEQMEEIQRQVDI
jgi:tetratricopeptide (TPR) repeat protein